MKLTHIFDARVDINMPYPQFEGAVGTHVIFDVRDGVVTEVGGSGINGTIASVGGDWAFYPGDGYWRLDIRSVVDLSTGGRLLLRAQGLVEINAAVQAALTPPDFGEIQFGDAYFSSVVQFDIAPTQTIIDPTTFAQETITLPEEIALLRHRLGVTRGRFGLGFVEYQMFRVDDPGPGSAP